MNIFDLTGRVAVITGGNGGIGLGIAQALAGQGCNVSIWGRNASMPAVAIWPTITSPNRASTRPGKASDSPYTSR